MIPAGMCEADGLHWQAGGSQTDDALGYEPHEALFEPLLRSLLPAGGVFLDVGAHVGRWTLRLASQASRVIAVEANPDTASVLLSNVAANGIGNVSVLMYAAWDARERLRLDDPNGKVHGGSTRTLPDVGGSVQGVPLDELLAGEPRIDLVKLDVEGADLHALRGMRQTLARCNPVMFIEDHSMYGYYDLGELSTLLFELGYVWGWTPQIYMSARYLIARPAKGGELYGRQDLPGDSAVPGQRRRRVDGDPATDHRPRGPSAAGWP